MTNYGMSSQKYPSLCIDQLKLVTPVSPLRQEFLLWIFRVQNDNILLWKFFSSFTSMARKRLEGDLEGIIGLSNYVLRHKAHLQLCIES